MSSAGTAAGRSGLTPRRRADLGEPALALGARADGGVVVGGSEGRVCAFAPDGGPLWSDELDDALLAVSVSPDGTRVLALGMSRRRMWDADGRRIADDDAGWSATASWDQRSARVAVGDGRRVRLLDRDGQVRWSSSPLASTVTAVLWPRGRRRVAAAAYRGVTILEPETDRVTDTLVAPGAISGLAAAPNGRWVVGGSQDATLHGWKVDDGTDFRMSGFPTTVTRLAFEGTGRWMACCSGDVVTCWDFSGAGPTGREAAVLTGHDATVNALAWLPGDGRMLVTGDEAGAVRLWRLDASTRPGARLSPVGGRTDDDPVTAIAVGGPRTAPRVHVARRSGRLDAMTAT